LQAKTYSTSGKKIRIVDWEGETQARRSALMAAALASGDVAPVEVWTGTLPEESRTALRRFGFVEREVRSLADYFPTVLIRPVARDAPDRPWRFGGRNLLDLASWDLRILDSDGS
jgi:hypothetical protein